MFGNAILKRPIIMVVLVNMIGFFLLYLFKKPTDPFILLAGLSVIVLNALAYFIIRIKKLGDPYLFLIVSMLVSFGVIMLCRMDMDLGLKQLLWFVLGITLFFVSNGVYLKYKKWDQLIYFYFGASILLYLVTLGMGSSIKGARNWIIIGGFNFQPSELIKIIFVFFLAAYYKYPEKLELINFNPGGKKIRIRQIVMMAGAFTYLGFLVLQREWGTSLLLFLIYFTMLYVFHTNTMLLLVNGAAAICGAVGGYLFMHYIQIRVSIWMDPWADVADKGYQIAQSLFAIGEGGFFGTGLGLGRPDFIPEVHNDFIFSAICEEMGIFGGVAVVLLYFILAYRGLKIALYLEDTFRKAVALGITVMFGFQTFIIIGGVIKLIPLTGITLPFVSYGGSSLTTSFIALGILQAISNKKLDGEEEASHADK
ncbi:MAG: FtsW/RodA/SpoVE family cell cycle protein [Clostridia bacterium]|nr:FtsW/RodA/SpoVE family cell cycle protein [Clostridia bacterium]